MFSTLTPGQVEVIGHVTQNRTNQCPSVVCIQPVHTCLHSIALQLCRYGIYIYMYVYVSLCMYIYICVYLCNVCMYVCMNFRCDDIFLVRVQNNCRQLFTLGISNIGNKTNTMEPGLTLVQVWHKLCCHSTAGITGVKTQP